MRSFYYVILYRRVNFSDLDDHHLCRYLAVTVPDKKDGGRTGNTIYQELEELVRILHLRIVFMVFTPTDAFTLCYRPLAMTGQKFPRRLELGETTYLAFLAKSIQ